VARDPQRLADAARELDALAIAADVAAADAAQRIGSALAAHGVERLDVAVLGAGIPGRGVAQDATMADARRVVETNYLGMVAVTRAVWPRLRAARGCVINICSVAGMVAVPGAAVYTASKHATVGWSRALAATAPRDGVRVLTVHPGPVATTGFPQAGLRRRRFAGRVVITPDRCSVGIMAAFDRGAAEVFIPRWWRLAVIAQATAPGVTRRLAARIDARTRPG
jgi:uncharacterized protein